MTGARHIGCNRERGMKTMAKRRLNLKVELVRPLQADELDAVAGGKADEVTVPSNSGEVSKYGSLTACPVGPSVPVSQTVGCW